MARRRRSSKKSDGDLIFDIIVAICLPIILLLSSKNPVLKGLGGILLFILVIMYAGASSGFSSEEMAALLCGVFIVGLILVLIFANKSGKNEKTNAGQNTKREHTYPNGAAVKTATIKKVEATTVPTTLPKVQSTRSFDELFAEMEKEIMSIAGPETGRPAPKEEKRTEEKRVNKGLDTVPVVSLNKKTPENLSHVLPKITVPESKHAEKKSEETPSDSHGFSFMNAPEDEESENTAASITQEKNIKDEFFYDSVAEAIKAHSVPAGYKKIMIHHIENTDIRECPALIWKEENILKLLPLIRKTHIFQWPLKSIPLIIGERHYNPDYDNEYTGISKAALSKEFLEQLPEYPYGREGVYTDLFILPVGVSVTNTSAKALFELLKVDLFIDDEITKSDQYVPAIKEIYRKHYLYENHVLTLEEYTSLKEEILEEFLETERSDSVYQKQIKHLQRLEL